MTTYRKTFGGRRLCKRCLCAWDDHPVVPTPDGRDEVYVCPPSLWGGRKW